MPHPDKSWWHVVLSTHGSSLPGDPRGFRSKKHKIHSSGDYKTPPPAGEHAGLHAYHQFRTEPIVLTEEDWPLVGNALWDRLVERGHEILIIAVGATHCHFQAKLPHDYKAMKREVGEVKRVSALAVHASYPGGIWAGQGDFNRIETREYQRSVYHYILRQKNAWIRTYKDNNPEARG